MLSFQYGLIWKHMWSRVVTKCSVTCYGATLSEIQQKKIMYI